MKSGYEVIHPPVRGRRKAHPEARPRGPAPVRKRLGRVLLAALILAVGVGAWSAWCYRADRAYNGHNLIRLHVVANSDKPTDQAVKLEVRDALLKTSGDLLSTRTVNDAVKSVQQNLPLFKRVAENVLKANGYDYAVDVEFGIFSFPERTYGPLLLPAGDYEALRVVLGDGKGANWWCILFPPLCYLDVVGNRDVRWTVTPTGRLAGPTGEDEDGTKVIPLNSLTLAQAADLERVLGRALDSAELQPAPSTQSLAPTEDGSPVAAGGPGGLGVIISDVPAAPDSDLIVLVADTGANKVEVRFYVLDKLRELVRSLADIAPWLFDEGAPALVQQPAPSDR